MAGDGELVGDGGAFGGEAVADGARGLLGVEGIGVLGGGGLEGVELGFELGDAVGLGFEDGGVVGVDLGEFALAGGDADGQFFGQDGFLDLDGSGGDGGVGEGVIGLGGGGQAGGGDGGLLLCLWSRRGR